MIPEDAETVAMLNRLAAEHAEEICRLLDSLDPLPDLVSLLPPEPGGEA